jgi:WD40 repeat protein
MLTLIKAQLSIKTFLKVLIEHEGGITSVAVPVNNQIIVSGSKDKLVMLWSFKEGSVLHKLTSHADSIVKVAITHDGSIVVSGSRDGLVNVWASHNGNLLTSLNLQHILGDLLVSFDGSHLVARLDDSHHIPIIGLTKKWSKDLVSRSISQSSLKSLRSYERKERPFLFLVVSDCFLI